jgi:putative phosphoribosyl transferase
MSWLSKLAPPTFRDRRDAGQRLGQRLKDLCEERPVVIALPRGGVPVAYEVARALEAPLDVLIVRKIGHPMQPELGVGALCEDGTLLLNRDALGALDLGEAELEPVIAHERAELERRRSLYRGRREPLPVSDRTVVLVDDGLATGVTAEAAVRGIRALAPKRVVLAVPVAAPDSVARLQCVADDVVTVMAPEGFTAVGSWYRDFTPTSDREVTDLLTEARLRKP